MPGALECLSENQALIGCCSAPILSFDTQPTPSPTPPTAFAAPPILKPKILPRAISSIPQQNKKCSKFSPAHCPPPPPNKKGAKESLHAVSLIQICLTVKYSCHVEHHENLSFRPKQTDNSTPSEAADHTSPFHLRSCEGVGLRSGEISVRCLAHPRPADFSRR